MFEKGANEIGLCYVCLGGVGEITRGIVECKVFYTFGKMRMRML